MQFLWCYLNLKNLSRTVAGPQRSLESSNGIEKRPVPCTCPHLEVFYGHSFSHGVLFDFGIAFVLFESENSLHKTFSCYHENIEDGNRMNE